MSGITIVSSDSSLVERVRAAVDDGVAIRTTYSTSWASPERAADEICLAAPELALFGPDIDDRDVDDLVAAIDRQHPRTASVVMLDRPERDLMVAVLRAGARDVVEDASDDDLLRQTLQRTLDLVGARRASQSGGGRTTRTVIAVVSPKGGAGKTTVATNLATGLGRRHPGKVLLLDLDLQFGDCASALGLEPEFSLTQAVGVTVHDRTALKVFAAQHDSGAALLGPPEDLALSEELTPEAIKRTLGALAEEYPYLVVDTAGGIDEFALVALEFATDLLMVTTTDIPAIRAVRRQVDALDQLGITGPRRHLVLNRADARVGLTVGDIESTIGLRAEFQMPSSRAFPLSTNQGSPVILDERKDKATTSMQAIADHFAPPEVEQRSGGWLRRKDR